MTSSWIAGDEDGDDDDDDDDDDSNNDHDRNGINFVTMHLLYFCNCNLSKNFFIWTLKTYQMKSI